MSMRAVLVVPLLTLACTQTPTDGRFGGGGITPSETDPGSADLPSDDPASSTGESSSGEPHDDADDDPKFDVGSDTMGPPACAEGQTCGCNAVDLLFVIDSSSSMGSYQAALAAAAPGFTTAMFDSLPPSVDLHVGVTTTSFSTLGGGSPGEINCQSAGTTDEFFANYHTSDVEPNGENGGQGRLRTHEGKAWFETSTSDDPSPLEAWLTGNITAVGEHGSVFEMPAAAAGWAFHQANAATNAGFVRDEGAVLVLFILSDEVGNSPEDAAVYHDMVVAAKAGCGGDACVVTGAVMKPCVAMAEGNTEYAFLSSFGDAPVLGDIGPKLDNCYEDCDSGDIDVCPVNGLSCGDVEAWTQGYADALGVTLAQIIADTCAAIPPVG